MPIVLRRANERGHANHGWLDTFHTFSFADYHDEAHMGFGVLRVINEDRIAGGSGFPTHGHRDMEIVTYVVKGALEHKDSMGNHSVIHPGEVQRMSAGTGIQHSEFNHLKDQETHIFQIWILPQINGLEPSYEQKLFDFSDKDLTLVLSPNGRNGSLRIHQDVEIYIGKPASEGGMDFKTSADRRFWIQMVSGMLSVNNVTLQDSDGASLDAEKSLSLNWNPCTQFILFNLP